MPLTTSPSTHVPGEALVLRRAFPAAQRLAVAGASDAELRGLVGALTADGWSTGSDAVLTLALDEDVASDPASVGPSTVVLAVRERRTPAQRGWPVWDARLVADGEWVGCLATEGWTVYVRAGSAEELGALLSFPATDAERFPDGVETTSRAALVEEIVHWRAAALQRWATRAVEQSGRTSKELENEIAQLRHVLDETHRTFSWRITAPLRTVQAARLKAARR